MYLFPVAGKNGVLFFDKLINSALLPGGDIGESVVALNVPGRFDDSPREFSPIASASPFSTKHKRSSDDRQSRTHCNIAL